ncbi:phosphoethanolamine--lipid A transferase [Rhizobium sp. KVB221]|uniref:Phosphoethanolamine--lipid A transferase n=1 Tax=Rhizobium setariae TaxID=2801340 RepID=A0A936YSC9_9HYPH|nr:phosphoethanolamine--lipid A transferase [Rhizobium setariae]MBL0374868.1 phosphoethanolamine--lipid A transferase [Rhizobium setariae]
MTFPKRPEIGSNTLAVIVSLYLLAVGNLTFWRRAVEGFGVGPVFWGFALMVAALFIASAIAVSSRFLAKPIYIFLVLVSAPAAYFTDTFGTIIDRAMIENAVTTTSGEAKYLVTWQFGLHILLFGILPSLLILWVRVRHRPFFSKVIYNSAAVAALLLAAGGFLYSQLGAVVVTIRENHDMLEIINPSGPLTSAVNYSLSAYGERNLVRKQIATDAHRGPWISAEQKPVVTILVVGETARSMNFSLNGYQRQTNPELQKLDVLNFPYATSCGTDTAYSVPCMFSIYPRDAFSKRKAKATQSLMDVVRRAGVDAYWWDNNTGSKGVADLISFTSLTGEKDPVSCARGDCLDSVFLKRLDALVGAAKKDTVVVLHQIGSHGPAYYMRYPEAFRKFQPDCRTPQLTNCSIDEVVNAYDNTILYTDHFLASVIGILKKHNQTAAGAFLYMSDHGESLGENGLYLHGAPYAIAPPEQTHIPMIAWLSPDYRNLSSLDDACLKQLPGRHYSHDNYFHTVLGLMNIQTTVYKPELDVFKECRNIATGHTQ